VKFCLKIFETCSLLYVSVLKYSILAIILFKVWGSNPEPIKSLIRCQRLATVATLIVWA